MKSKLGVYVGSFNPVHDGHINIVKYLLNNKYVDKVLIVPTLNYWNKNNLIDIKHRINMLKFFEDDNIIIDTLHNKYIYTYELLNILSNEYIDYDLYLVMGADNIVRFNEWKNVEEILKYNIIVLKRGNIDINAYIDKYNYDRSKFIVIDNYPFINISSTDIRNNTDNSNISSKVYKYIKDNNLYGRNI